MDFRFKYFDYQGINDSSYPFPNKKDFDFNVNFLLEQKGWFRLARLKFEQIKNKTSDDECVLNFATNNIFEKLQEKDLKVFNFHIKQYFLIDRIILGAMIYYDAKSISYNDFISLDETNKSKLYKIRESKNGL